MRLPSPGARVRGCHHLRHRQPQLRAGRDRRLTLATVVRESIFRAGAMVSRMAQLAVVDALFTGVAKVDLARTVDALKRTRAATQRAHQG